MSSPSIALPGLSPVLWLRRVRALFTGIGYVAVFQLCLVAAWTLQSALPDLLSADGAAVRHNVLATADVLFLATLPGLVFLTAGVNLAPRHGWRRLLWLGALALLMEVTCELIAGDLFNASPFALLDGLLNACLAIALCDYHSRREGAKDIAVRTQIGAASLDAELKRAQLQLLRAQIEPHFLFNTLSAVRALSRIDRRATVDMLDNLIRYFEATLPRLRQDEATLEEEMRLIDAYLGIYRVRMGSRLGYEVALPTSLALQRVPAMMLLTLVENALKHGVNPIVEGGFIRVSASRERDTLILKVADSGRGLIPRQGQGMGLANVRQRLLMHYGESAVLSLAHAEPRGVVATIEVPLV
jgi:signal transduction histidine kinase